MNARDKNTIVTTGDGSHTLYSEHFGEHYHSTFGAIQESAHIFIQGALDKFQHTQPTIHILEIGFGTGLNALLTLIWADKHGCHVNYHGLEAYPISIEEAGLLNYCKELNFDQELFLKLHDLSEKPVDVSEYFTIRHIVQALEKAVLTKEAFDVVYFDAFSPDVQPELWSFEVFQKLYQALRPGGILTTYSCKGAVKRALKKAGFKIEKLPGPPGKREFLRALKS